MPSPATVDAFVAEVLAGRYVEAIEGFYAEDASMQENTDPPRVGRDLLVAGEKRMMSRAAIAARLGGPVLIDGDRVAIRWQFDFTDDAGTRRRLDEIAWQRWEGEKVVEEIFFYNPKQLA